MKANKIRCDCGCEFEPKIEYRHRLLCGDSTKAEGVGRVMGGENADLCFTSPPYGQQRDYTAEWKENGFDWDGLMRGVFSNLPMTDAGQVLVNLGLIHRENEWIAYWDGWIAWMREQGWRRFGWYVWDQGFGLPGDWSGRLAPSHEFVFHFNRKSVHPDKWVDKQPENIKPRNKNKSTMRGKDGKTKAFTNPATSGQPTKIPDSIIRVGRQVGSDGHPAQFPIEFPMFILQTWPGPVYEPFMGSGTTMVACQNLSRKCYGIEISPAYCAVILQRMTDAFPDISITRIDK
jgi:DNA modification methylase